VQLRLGRRAWQIQCRFELLHLPHWSYTEMRSAFDWSLEQYIFYGGYPGAASLIRDEQRWRRYILDSLIRNDDCPRCSVADACGQPGNVAQTVRAGMPIFRSDSVVYQDSWAAAGRWQFCGAGTLSGPARARGHGLWFADYPECGTDLAPSPRESATSYVPIQSSEDFMASTP
jgi:hypothetical protein